MILGAFLTKSGNDFSEWLIDDKKRLEKEMEDSVKKMTKSAIGFQKTIRRF